MTMFSRKWRVVTVALAVLMVAFNIANIFGQSPTVDEFAHVPAGYSYWIKQDFSLYSKNPPLIKMLLTLPLNFMDLRFPEQAYEQAAGPWAPWFFGEALARANPNNILKVYAAARIMNMLLGALLGLLVFGAIARWFGPVAGAAAMALTVTSPTLLAHTSVATVDVGTTLFFLLALLFFHRSLEWPGLLNTVLAGIALGLALLSKFTCLLLLPIWGVQVLVTAGLTWRQRCRNTAVRDELSSLLVQRLVTGLAVPTVALVILNGGYLFQQTGVTLNQTHGASRFIQALINNGLDDVSLPFPKDYLTGLDLQLTDVEQGEFPSYLNGRWQKEGSWYYFGEALLLKETIPGIFILLLALTTIVWRRLKSNPGPALGRTTPLWLFLYFPALIFFTVVSLSGNLQLGVRYMLPVIPLFFMAAAIVLLGDKNVYTANKEKTKRIMFARAALVCAVCLWQGVAVVRVHPHFLSYFNCVAGFNAADGGAAYLLDSNIDWGQDLPALADTLEKLGNPEIGLLYFGHAHPDWYGIKAHLPGPNDRYVAVSVNFLYGYPYALPYLGRWVQRPPMITDKPLQGVRQLASYYKTRRPLCRAGGSIYLYDNNWPGESTGRDGQHNE